MRGKKALTNTLLGFMQQAILLICAFILPRLILTSFGSDYNGLTNAITQFLQVVVLFQAGIGGVTRAALFKPLASKDVTEINRIVKITENFLKKVSIIFLAISLLVAVVYPYFVRENFDWIFTATLVLIMSLSTFSQYFFGLPYHFLIQADQRQGFLSVVSSIQTILSTIICVILINSGFGIHAVKLGSAVVFVIAPIFINFYAKRRYGIQKNIELTNAKLPQLWDNFGQQVAMFVCSNTPLIVLTILSNVYEISVYVIYNMVMTGVYGLFQPLVNGISSAFGNMFAKGEYELIKKNFRILEQVVFSSSAFLFGVTAATVVPFVKIYTEGVSDANYERTLFAYIFVAATLFQCYRMPYAVAVIAVGHFKQTRNAAFIEAGLNIVLSIVLVLKFGIVGVVIATLAAYIFRVSAYALYTSRNIIRRSFFIFIKRISLSVLCAFVIASLPHILPINQQLNYVSWLLHTSVISIIGLLIIIGVELVFYREDMRMLLVKLLHSVKKA